MIFIEIPQAAGITGILTAAGLNSSAVHDWFHRPRRELAWLTPAVDLLENGRDGAGSRVLELARADAVAVMADPPSYRVNVRGAGCAHRWRGTVSIAGEPGRFVLDRDDASCPRCGGNASTVTFGADLAGGQDDA